MANTPPKPPPPRDVARCDDAKSVGWGDCSNSILALLLEKDVYPAAARQCLDAIDACMDRGLTHHQAATQSTYQWCDQVESYVSGFLLCHDAASITLLRGMISDRLEAAPRIMAATISSIEAGLALVHTAIGLLFEFRVAINRGFVVTWKHTRAQRDDILRKLDAADTCFEATRDALQRAAAVFKSDAQLVSAIKSRARLVRLFIASDNVTLRRAHLEDNCTNLVRCCKSYKNMHREYIDYLLQ